MSDVNDPKMMETLYELKKLFLHPEGSSLALHSFLGFSEEEIDSVYAMACQKLNMGDLAIATQSFTLLVFLKHSQSKYWRGLAMCHHRQKTYHVADFLYTMALRLDPQDVISRTFHAEVLLWMNQKTAAYAQAQRAAEEIQAHKTRDNLPYLQRAEAIMATIQSADFSVGFERVQK